MQVKFYATLRDLLGLARMDVPAAGMTTVGAVLDAIALAHPELNQKLWDADHNLTSYLTILLNGRSIEYLQGPATPVNEADVISLFPPIGGG